MKGYTALLTNCCFDENVITFVCDNCPNFFIFRLSFRLWDRAASQRNNHKTLSAFVIHIITNLHQFINDRLKIRNAVGIWIMNGRIPAPSEYPTSLLIRFIYLFIYWTRIKKNMLLSDYFRKRKKQRVRSRAGLPEESLLIRLAKMVIALMIIWIPNQFKSK